MSKLRLLLVGACALAAFFAVNGTASALSDPGCDQYGNNRAIYEFFIDTPDSHKQYAISSVEGGGIACGTNISFPCVGGNSLYDHATIDVPPGVTVAETAGHEGQDVGSANVNVLYFAACFPIFDEAVASTVVANETGTDDCTRENNDMVGDPAPGSTMVACYRGSNILGENWNWVTSNDNSPSGPGPEDEFWMTIGPMHGILGVDPGLTRIGMSLCANFGCGGSGDFIQKNGAQSRFPTPACSNGKGIYTATATNRGNQVTPPASSCVKWFPVDARRL